MRFDVGYFSIDGSYDVYLEDYLAGRNIFDRKEIDFYAQRVNSLNKYIYDLSWNLGAYYHAPAGHSVKLYLGQSFRLPSVSELSSNGMHHGAFRHEQGHPALKSEKGVQFDGEYRYGADGLEVAISPFASYYFSYIYLEPTGKWSVLPHAGQRYQYRAARAAMWGGEAEVGWHFLDHYRLMANAALLWQRNLTDGYPLPFCPPVKLQAEGEYRVHGIPERCGTLSLTVLPSYTFAQRDVARNETPTEGYALLDVSVRYAVQRRGWGVTLTTVCSNVFNKKYFNHLSFYRTLNIPEVGRSFRASVGITI